MTSRRLPTWREMHMDTSPEIEAIQFEFYREAPAWRKIEMMSSLSNSVRQLTIQGIRRRHPEATAQEIDFLLLEHFHGLEIAKQVRATLAHKQDGSDESSAYN